jgi:hypothetical protein
VRDRRFRGRGVPALRLLLAFVVVLLATLLGAVDATPNRPLHRAIWEATPRAESGKLNGSFERGVSGWRAYAAIVRGDARAALGRRSARVSALAAETPFALSLAGAPRVTAGVMHTLRAWIRSSGAQRVCMELHERPTPSTAAARACFAVTAKWRRGVVRYRAVGGGNRLAVSLTSVVGARGGGFLVDGVSLSKTAPATRDSSRGRLLWSADHETGDLDEWSSGGGGEYNNGDADTVVSTRRAHTGRHAAEMTITAPPESGTRLFRTRESRSGVDAYYGVWYFIPRPYAAAEYWNLFQFKSETDSENEPWWVLDVAARSRTGRPYFFLRYKGTLPGPRSGDVAEGEHGTKYFWQTTSDIPIGRWLHVEVFLRQSSRFSGRIVVWQNGTRLFDLAGVKTKFVGGDQRWSVNNYSNGLQPQPSVIYVDDATIHLGRPGRAD